jgi:hypothetical protein
VKLVSNVADTSATNDYSGIDFDVPAGTTFGSLTALRTQFDVTDDDCAAGSPRFQINIGGKNVFVYLGPTPNFTGCAAGTNDSGNLIGSTDARFDLTQYGGPFYGTYQQALALLGSQVVTGIQLVIDSGWALADGEQTVLVDNVQINGTTYTFTATPTSTPQCKGRGLAVVRGARLQEPGRLCELRRHRRSQHAGGLGGQVGRGPRSGSRRTFVRTARRPS